MRWGILLLPFLLSSCAWMGLDFGIGKDHEPPPEPTLADLDPARLPDQNIALPSVDLDDLTQSYQEVMASSASADVKVQVMHRLAGLEMVRGEQRAYDAQTSAGIFDQAIAAYEDLLKEHPEREGVDRLKYQLSKAYDLNGQPEDSLRVLDELVTQDSGSGHYAEAQFRRAEIYFVAADYDRAEQAYAEVIGFGPDTRYYRNALYMHGWTQFKREHHRASIKSFSETLDLIVPPDNNLEDLARAERELAKDSFRVLSLVFAYLEGPKTIEEVYASLGERHYEPLLFDNLGELYLGQERYRDSAEVYRSFVSRHPGHELAPSYSGKLIKSFEAGDFPAQVLIEKENYVSTYGISSSYWAAHEESVHQQIQPFLKQYFNELARHYHALAQSHQSSKEKNKARAKQNRALAKQYFGTAGDYYQAYVDTFPQDPLVAEMTFLLAEARYEEGDFAAAIKAYEIVAYEYASDKRAAEAGYSAILSHDEHLKILPEAEHENWQRLKIESELRFADQFVEDKRAPTVLTRAAEELLAFNEYEQAVAAARKLTAWQAPIESKLQRTAWLVIGHGEFELQHYAEAEVAYQQTLTLTAAKSAERKDLVERLAASVYKQAEQQLARGDQLAAARQFLRVAEVAPNSTIRVNAQFDAATNLLAVAAWGQAIDVLKDFRTRFPKHKLTADIPGKLVYAYQENGEWHNAATELSAIHERETDPKAKREALFLAAGLFARADDKEIAILRYRSYAHTYPEPFPVAMEARFRLSELYRETGQDAKRRFWLKKMIVADKGAGAARTERSRYLAAFSSQVFADYLYVQFVSIKLSLPLKKSLKKKKIALDKALKANQRTIEYGVEEFATKATFKVGAIYTSLSSDLMASERPRKLDALALEQYQILLEEQAYPFEEKAIEIHEGNAQRSWSGIYDEWVKQSFAELGKLLPARYRKQESELNFSDDIY